MMKFSKEILDKLKNSPQLIHVEVERDVDTVTMAPGQICTSSLKTERPFKCESLEIYTTGNLVLTSIRIDHDEQLAFPGEIPAEVFGPDAGCHHIPMSICKNTIEVVLKNIDDRSLRARLRFYGVQLTPPEDTKENMRKMYAIPLNDISTIWSFPSGAKKVAHGRSAIGVESSGFMKPKRLIHGQDGLDGKSASLVIVKIKSPEISWSVDLMMKKEILLDQYLVPQLHPGDVFMVLLEEPITEGFRAGLFGVVEK